jgi:hypothetical protein
MLKRVREAFFGILFAAAICVLACSTGFYKDTMRISYLSEQYSIELLGVMICFSQTVLFMTLMLVDRTKIRRLAYQKFKKLTAIDSSSSQKSLSTSL